MAPNLVGSAASAEWETELKFSFSLQKTSFKVVFLTQKSSFRNNHGTSVTSSHTLKKEKKAHKEAGHLSKRGFC